MGMHQKVKLLRLQKCFQLIIFTVKVVVNSVVLLPMKVDLQVRNCFLDSSNGYFLAL